MTESVVLTGSTDHDKLLCLQTQTYKAQAIWFLNAYWTDYQGEAETIWQYVNKCQEIDTEKGKAGCALDELNAHRFLESLGETLTVLALRSELRKTGAIGQTERPKLVPLTHYLLFKYKVSWADLVNTKGDNSEELKEAQRMLDEVMIAFDQSEAKAKEARNLEAEARRLEAPFKAAQEEVEAALAEVKAQEDAFEKKKNDLTKRSEEGGAVTRNKAKAELAQLLAEDPLPLRKAKITLEAALKRAEKARGPFQEATNKAEASRKEAEDALENTRQRVREAEAAIEIIKNKPGSPFGAIWWMERELHEKKKYLPTAKGGIRA